MDKSFYKKEAETLQAGFEQLKQTATSQKKQTNKDLADAYLLSKGGLIIGIILALLIVGIVASLTIWLLN
jgi:hypothetical protein